MNCLWSISVIFTLLALEVRTYYAIPVEMATGKFNYVENNQCQTSIVRINLTIYVWRIQT